MTTISSHLLRRTARAREHQIEQAQRTVGSYVTVDERRHAQLLLERWHVGQFERVRVVKAKRGPWRWRVVSE